MLNILRSGFCSLGHERVLDEAISLAKSGEKVLLIVPEQQTVTTEAQIADMLRGAASLNLEVTNFTRLANSTARTLGGLSAERCDSTRASLIMWQTLTELAPALTVTENSRGISEGLVSRAISAVNEMQSLGVSADELASCADSEQLKGEGRLLGKLSDLSKIYSLYKNLLSERYSDAGDDCALMLRALYENPTHLSDTHIFIEGFTSFTEPQYRIISALAERTALTVLLTMPKGAEGLFEYTEVSEAESRLKSDARRSGTQIKLLYENNPQKTPDSIRSLSELLWRNYGDFDNISLQNPEEIRIFEAKDPFEECRFIAADIRHRLMMGACASDIAIASGDVQKYEGILDSALKEADIRAFISRGREICDFDAIKLIFSLYSVIRSHFSRQSLITYAKCPLSPIGREECDELEIYAETWQINGSRFTDGILWNMNPEGYSTRHTDAHAQSLVRINGIREKLISPLLAFEQDALAAKTVREQAVALYNHLTFIGMEEKLAERAKELMKIGEAERAEQTERLWKTVCDSLDTVVEVLGDLKSDPETFLSLLKIAFSGADIARIPSYFDEITVGDADMLRLYGKKHVYLIGVNMGEFPASHQDSSYFSEKDRAVLSRFIPTICPRIESTSARELYVFNRSFTYARESLTLSYCACDTKFKPKERSDAIDRIIRLTGVSPVKISSIPLPDRIFNKYDALLMLGEAEGDVKRAVRDALVASGEKKCVEVALGDITNSSLKLYSEELASKKAVSLTQSRIDTFSACPLSYFCRYTLSLKEVAPAEFDAANIGTFIHAILENVLRELEKENYRELTSEQMQALTRRAAQKYMSDIGEMALGVGITKIKIERLVRAALPVVEGLCEELEGSLFRPKFFELAIKAGDAESPEPAVAKSAAGRDVYVYGYIDRVDTYKKGEDVYVRVIDYKTGRKDFSPDDLKEGKNLQMFLYLKSILDTKNEKFKERIGLGEGGRLIPAGVIYVKTSITDKRIDIPSDELAREAVKEAQGREGMVLDDEEIISAMNMRYTPLYSKRTPDKIPDSKRKYLFTEESFDGMMSDALSTVSDVADRICEGDASASPRDDGTALHCEMCEFKPICRSKVITS